MSGATIKARNLSTTNSQPLLVFLYPLCQLLFLLVMTLMTQFSHPIASSFLSTLDSADDEDDDEASPLELIEPCMTLQSDLMKSPSSRAHGGRFSVE